MELAGNKYFPIIHDSYFGLNVKKRDCVSIAKIYCFEFFRFLWAENIADMQHES